MADFDAAAVISTRFQVRALSRVYVQDGVFVMDSQARQEQVEGASRPICDQVISHLSDPKARLCSFGGRSRNQKRKIFTDKQTNSVAFIPE